MHACLRIAVVWCCILGLTKPGVSWGQSRVVSVGDAIRIALEQSYAVKSADSRREARRQSYEYYRLMFSPRVDLGMFAPSFTENVSAIQQADDLPVYNSVGSLRMGGDIRFTYMLPTGGHFALSSQLYQERLTTRLALQDNRKLENDQAYTSLSLSFSQDILTRNELNENLERARYEYEKSASRFEREQLDIVYEVIERFYALYRATREKEIAGEKLANSEEAHRIAELKLATGRIPEGDVLIAEVQMQRDRAELMAREGDLASLRDSFIRYIGLPAGTNIRIATSLEYDTFDIDGDFAVEKALENRGELREGELDIHLQEIEVDRAERLREIKGEITAYYDFTGISTTGGGSTADLLDSSLDNFIDREPNRGVRLTFSYPILDWGRAAAKVSEESVRLREYKLTIEDTRRMIEQNVRDVVRRVMEARDRLAIHERTQAVSQQSYRISRMRFENGDMTSQELAREQERLAETQIEYLDAFIAYQLALNDLNRRTLWDFSKGRPYTIHSYLEE